MNSDELYYDIPGNLSALRFVIRRVGFTSVQRQDSQGQKASPFFRLVYVIKGRGRLFRAGQVFDIGPDTGFLISPNEIASCKADRDEPWSFYSVWFTGQNAQRFLEERGLYSATSIFKSRGGEASERAAEELFRAAAAAPSDEDGLLGRFLLLFSTFVTRAPDDLSPHTLYTEQACAYITDNFPYSISVEDVAHHVKIDRSHLYRLFKARYGVSVQEYLLTVRLRNAAMLLEDTSRPLGEICFSCGFNDYSHFSKSFAAAYGLSPREYRKRRAKE